MQDPNSLKTDSDYLWSKEYLDNARPHHDIICDYLQGRISGRILDIGERNPLTQRLEFRNDVTIENTTGDLEFNLETKYDNYDVIICSHVIEHLFNPLTLLINCKDALKPSGKMYLIAPVKPYWITFAKCHFHEMDFKNMVRLIERSGLKIDNWHEYSVPIPLRFGIRNLLRRIYKEYSIITLKA